MWKDIFGLWIREGKAESWLTGKLDTLDTSGELQDGEYQEILTIITAAFA